MIGLETDVLLVQTKRGDLNGRVWHDQKSKLEWIAYKKQCLWTDAADENGNGF